MEIDKLIIECSNKVEKDEIISFLRTIDRFKDKNINNPNNSYKYFRIGDSSAVGARGELGVSTYKYSDPYYSNFTRLTFKEFKDKYMNTKPDNIRILTQTQQEWDRLQILLKSLMNRSLNNSYWDREDKELIIEGTNLYHGDTAFNSRTVPYSMYPLITVDEFEERYCKKTTKTYKELQDDWIRDNNIKVGDKVKVVRRVEEGNLGWPICWARGMDEYVNRELTVKEIELDGLNLAAHYRFPFQSLEKVAEVVYKPVSYSQPTHSQAEIRPTSPDLDSPFNNLTIKKGKKVLI